MVPLPLTKCTRQVRERRGANALRERRRARRVREEAEDGGNRAPVRTGTSGGLIDSPSGFRNGSAGDLRQERGAGVGGVALDGRADAIDTALLAGVRRGVVGDLADVGEAADVCTGTVTGFQLPRATGC